MPSVAEHYSRLLADVYSWMYGGWDAALARYTEFFAARGIAPRGSKRAIDLGAGCGFQAIPLARLGFSSRRSTSIASCSPSSSSTSGGEEIEIVLRGHPGFPPPRAAERRSSSSAWSTRCCISTRRSGGAARERRVRGARARRHVHRDVSRLHVETKELDRFIPVRSDDHTVFTCFLEFEPADGQGARSRPSARRRAAGTSPRASTASCGCPTAWVVIDAAGGGLREGRDGPRSRPRRRHCEE